MFSSSGLYAIHDWLGDEKPVYVGLGTFVILVTLFLMCAIKDVVKDKMVDQQEQEF